MKQLIIERTKVRPSASEGETEMGMVIPPAWWLTAEHAQVAVERKDRVDHVGAGDVYQVIWSGLIEVSD